MIQPHDFPALKDAIRSLTTVSWVVTHDPSRWTLALKESFEKVPYSETRFVYQAFAPNGYVNLKDYPPLSSMGGETTEPLIALNKVLGTKMPAGPSVLPILCVLPNVKVTDEIQAIVREIVERQTASTHWFAFLVFLLPEEPPESFKPLVGKFIHDRGPTMDEARYLVERFLKDPKFHGQVLEACQGLAISQMETLIGQAITMVRRQVPGPMDFDKNGDLFVENIRVLRKSVLKGAYE